MDLRTGAFGLWAAASGDPARRALVRGVDGADSWATDLHKMLNVPYESALVAVRDGRALHGSMASAAPYLPAAGSDAALLPELQNSRRARGVAAWAAIALGRDDDARAQRSKRNVTRDEHLRDTTTVPVQVLYV